MGRNPEFRETLATTVDRSGRAVDLTLDLSEADQTQPLTVSFDEHTMVLVSGNKKDLFQAIDIKPEIIEQKRWLLEFHQARNETRRSAEQAHVYLSQTDRPQYVLPVQSAELTQNTAPSS